MTLPPSVFEVFSHAYDPGVGNGHRINLVKGQLQGTDDVSWSVLHSQRMRTGNPPDRALAKLLPGWSNGWVGIRVVR